MGKKTGKDDIIHESRTDVEGREREETKRAGGRESEGGGGAGGYAVPSGAQGRAGQGRSE